MTTFKEAFQALPVPERRRIAEASGTSLGYLSKHMYTSAGQPKFTFGRAVQLDVASKGALPFWMHTEGTVDWLHVLRRLRTAKRRGELGNV